MDKFRTLALVILLGVGIFMCTQGDIHVIMMTVYAPILGAIFIVTSVLGFLGVNVFKGGPLDKNRDVNAGGGGNLKPKLPVSSDMRMSARRNFIEQNAEAIAQYRANWVAFAAELKSALGGVDHFLMMAVPDEGMVRVEHDGETWLSFDRPDDSGKFDGYGDTYIYMALDAPEYAFIKARVIGLDHNRVLYVMIEMTDTPAAGPGYSISFDPDWQTPTKLALGMDIEKGKWELYDTKKFEQEY